MSPEENKAVVKKFYQLIEENNYDALKELCHPDFRFYSQIDHPLSADEFIRQEKNHMDACPGFTMRIHNMFAEGDKVDVTGTSKGHGYSGVIQRWNSHRIGPMSHGTGPIHRSVGSMGACSSPSRVFKNKHMAGQWGHEKVTMQNLAVVRVDKARNLLLIKGAVPGPKGGIVMIRDSVKG